MIPFTPATHHYQTAPDRFGDRETFNLCEACLELRLTADGISLDSDIYGADPDTHCDDCSEAPPTEGPPDRRAVQALLDAFAATCKAEQDRQAAVKACRRILAGALSHIRRCNVCRRALVWSQLRNPRVWRLGDPEVADLEIAECGCGNTLSREIATVSEAA